MRSATFTMLLLTWLVSAPSAQLKAQEKGKVMTVKKITPVLFAEEIEPCLNFWVERLGFEKTIDVPEGNKLAFAILQKGGVELMYQTYASAQKDVSAVGPELRKGPSFLYVEVENLDEIIDNLRHVTENLNSFTETIKTRPYTLIRASGIKPRQPGQAAPK